MEISKSGAEMTRVEPTSTSNNEMGGKYFKSDPCVGANTGEEMEISAHSNDFQLINMGTCFFVTKSGL